MRHRNSGRKLNRTNAHRKALMRNMALALLTHERIRTTEAKAKELRKVVESLVTLALRDDLHSRRLAYKALNNHQMVQRLFDEIAPRFKDGNGGYTRILKLALPRRGDNAPMVVIELTKLAEAAAPAEKAPAEKASAEA
ncbi:50S ribosomal protein L17 [Paucidesulfovibrio longus]|uniref:50S ribosomal protein L17 n=1 Tax=Paucidesulfovibrio longus TaxID=889 RepID=UPI0003B5F814|nr:50S ribosomal protein L17 [Paucidesulfovibrio longus]